MSANIKILIVDDDVYIGDMVAAALTKQGYQLVTVQELFELKGRTLEPGVLYSSRVTAEK